MKANDARTSFVMYNGQDSAKTTPYSDEYSELSLSAWVPRIRDQKFEEVWSTKTQGIHRHKSATCESRLTSGIGMFAVDSH